MNFYFISLFGALASSLVSCEFVSEFRIKVGETLEKLNYPETVKNIYALGEESIIYTAIDFEKGFKPKFVQLALIPTENDAQSYSPITFDMDYKESSSKATFNINLKRLNPGLIKLGSEYEVKLFTSREPQSKDRLNWAIGKILMPKRVDFKLPEIEDHFYWQPEIYTPEELGNSEGNKNPIYPIIGIVATVLIPWICFINLWKSSGSDFTIPGFLLKNSKSRAFPFFIGSLLLLFVLIISSWVFLNIFQTLSLLALFSSSAFVFGHKSFKSLVNERESESNNKKTE